MKNPLSIGIVAVVLIGLLAALSYEITTLQFNAKPDAYDCSAIGVSIIFAAFYAIYSQLILNWLRGRLVLRMQVKLLQSQARNLAKTITPEQGR